MKTITTLATAVLFCCAGAASATDHLDLTVNVTGGASVAPGGEVTFEIVGELSSMVDNLGLALFGVDMSVSGPGTVNLSTDATISPPVSGDMHDFVNPDGLNNPTDCGGCFGFGGTASGNDLLQIGGGQNTIGNSVTYADFPLGDVTEMVGFNTNGGITVLADGTLTAPMDAGVYSIDLSNGFANVLISEVSTGPPDVYTTEAVPTVNTFSGGFTVEEEGCSALDARSLKDHGGTEFSLTMGVSGGIEPRTGQVTKLEIDLDSSASVSVTDTATVNCSAAWTGTATVTDVSTNGVTVTVEFSPSLPDQAYCVITLDCMTNDVCVRMCEGDMNRSGATNTTDASAVKTRFGATLTDANCEWDFNCSGAINTTDASAVKARFGKSAPACP